MISFVVNLFLNVSFKIKINGVENVPSEGGIVLCANHLSNFDPVVLKLRFPRNINFMAKKELFSNIFLSYILKKFDAFEVDRAKNDLNAYRTAMNILKSSKVLGIFIQGTRKTDIDTAKNGAAMFAVKSGTPVVPVGIKASYKFFSEININIGQPIYFNEINKTSKLDKETLESITQKISDAIKNLI